MLVVVHDLGGAVVSTGDRLRGKVAIVTGAAGGVGAAVVGRFSAEGAIAICVDIDTAVENVASRIVSMGGQAYPMVADVSDPAACLFVTTETERLYGGIDVLHLSAAVQVMGSLEVTEVENWDRMYAVNQRAAALSIKAVIPSMRRRGGGSIVLMSSLLAHTGDRDLPFYGATKGALCALAKSVAASLGPDQIRCNTISPGDIDTAMVQAYFEHQPNPEEARKAVEARYPLGRFASPHDVANLSVFLVSDEARYITGSDIVIDGGLRAQIY